MQPERGSSHHPFEFVARPVRLALRDRRRIHFRPLKETTSERVAQSFIIVLYGAVWLLIDDGAAIDFGVIGLETFLK
ncbi:hypothetical protein [Microvirga sp. G4-2]|uniref:hypothetical protein n=1 Tax=Microvirga sp. G4-2 TaxID=3434467 RepID=UPI004044EE6F